MPLITLHEVATSGQLIGVVSDRCMRHAMLMAVKAKAKVDDTRTPEEAGVYCDKCGSGRFQLASPHAQPHTLSCGTSDYGEAQEQSVRKRPAVVAVQGTPQTRRAVP